MQITLLFIYTIFEIEIVKRSSRDIMATKKIKLLALKISLATIAQAQQVIPPATGFQVSPTVPRTSVPQAVYRPGQVTPGTVQNITSIQAQQQAFGTTVQPTGFPPPPAYTAPSSFVQPPIGQAPFPMGPGGAPFGQPVPGAAPAFGQPFPGQPPVQAPPAALIQPSEAPAERPTWQWKTEPKAPPVNQLPKKVAPETAISKDAYQSLLTINPAAIQSSFKPEDAQKTDNSGNSPLAILIHSYEQQRAPDSALPANLLDSINFLLQQGVDINKANNEGRNPLLIAAEGGNAALVQFLLSKNARLDMALNSPDRRGYTELMAAAFYNHPSLIDPLLKAGANINARDRQGFSPLTFAVKGGNPAIVEALLNQPNNTTRDTKSDAGLTPLMYATLENNESIVKVLLSHQADKSIANNEGKTAADIAIDNKLPLAQLLRP